MKLRPRLLLLALTACCSFPVLAMPDTPAEPDPAVAALQERILSIVDMSGLTGLGIQARHVAQQVLNDTNAPLGQQYDVVDRIAPRWAPDQLQQRLGSLLQGYDEMVLQSLQSSFSNRRVVQARNKEQEAIREQGTPAYREYVQRLRLQPPPAERLRLIQELDAAMQFSGLLVETRAAVYPELQAVLRNWKPAEGWQEQVRREVTEFLLYAHRTTPNDELQRLADTYRAPELQAWLQTVRRQLGSS